MKLNCKKPNLMKFLKGLLIVLVVLVGGYSIWMATIPGEYSVERSAVIDAKPAAVYAVVSDFQTWKGWSTWAKRDATMNMEFGEISQGAGASYSWTSENSGNGSQEITDAVENESMNTLVKFEGMGESKGHWTFEETEDGRTNVTWGFSGEFPFFFRVFSLGMDDQVGKDFEEGFANLNEYMASMPADEASTEMVFEMVETTPMNYYSVTDEVAISDMTSQFFADRYGELMTFLGEDSKNMTGAPFALYHMWDMENNMTKVEVALSVSSELEGNERINKGMTYEGTAIKAVHVGSYDGAGAVHMALEQHMNDNNYEMAGPCWEVYVTDPGEEPDTTKWVTEIYYPVSVKAEKAGEA